MRTLLTVVAVGGVGIGAALAACSLTTDFSGISDRPTIAAGDHAVPPTRPAGDPTKGGGPTLWFGVKHLHFAHSNDALKVPGAWQDWGFDIDNVCTGALAKDQKGLCILRPGATADMMQDGRLCRDNNFGSQIVPKLAIYASTFENDTNAGLGEGGPSWILALDDVGPGADDPYVPGRLYLAGRMPDKVKPAWDGGDARKILTTTIKGGKIDDPVVTFPKGYLKGNVWVSGEAVDFNFSMPIGKRGALLPFSAKHAVIGLKLKDDHVSVLDGTGQFAGAMPISSLESFLAPFLSAFTAFCPGSTQYASFMESLPPFADVSLSSPTLQDDKSTCDGVSFGIGMNFAPVAVPTTTADPETDPPCGTVPPDAGADAPSDAATDAVSDG